MSKQKPVSLDMIRTAFAALQAFQPPPVKQEPLPTVSPQRQAELRLQAEMAMAVASGRPVEIPIYREVRGGADALVDARLCTPEDFRKVSIYPPRKNTLDALPEGTTDAERAIYYAHLRKIGDEDRQKLYATGGVEAVRDMAWRLAEKDLKAICKPKVKAKPKTKRKTNSKKSKPKKVRSGH